MTVHLDHSGERYTLNRPTVEFSVFEIRYDSAPQVDIELGYRMQRSLSKRVGKRWTVRGATWEEYHIDLRKDGPGSRATRGDGVRLACQALHAEINVFPDRAFVQVNRYQRWSTSLKPLIEATAALVENSLHPVGRTRIGLRYVNRFQSEDADSPKYWKDCFDRSLAGPIAAGPFADQVIQSESQLVLQLDEDVRTTLRHGLFSDTPSPGKYGYLLDIDTFDNSSALYRTDDVVQHAESLNRHSAELFRRSLNDRYASDVLGLHSVDSKQGNLKEDHTP